MERYTVIELRQLAKSRGMKGYSKLRKNELIESLKIKLSMKSDFISVLEPFLKPGIKFDESANAYLNKLMRKLVSRIERIEFVESLGYLGEEALDVAEKEKFVQKPIQGVKNVCTSNMVIYIGSELVDLLNYAAIEHKSHLILVSDVERVVRNDHDLNIAFN